MSSGKWGEGITLWRSIAGYYGEWKMEIWKENNLNEAMIYACSAI